MTSVPVLCAAGGADWEARLLTDLGDEGNPHGVHISRRCVDVVDLLALAAAGHGGAALVSASLRRLDADALERLTAAGVAVVAVLDAPPSAPPDATADRGNSPRTPDPAARRGGHAAGDIGADQGAGPAGEDPDSGQGDGGKRPEAERLQGLGVRHLVSAHAAAEVIAAAVITACADLDRGPETRVRAFGWSTAAIEQPPPAPIVGDAAVALPPGPGALVAVWGPAGGPGRTTVAAALADEIARLGRHAMLVDADVYGGAVATMLGLLDESPGIAAASRQAANGRLDAESLADLCWSVAPGLRVLTGLPRADRWPELRATGVERMLTVCRSIADFTVVDTGFCLETDEELSFDTAAPRRNGATLAVLDAADVVLAVGSADALGLARLVRGLEELREAQIAAPVWVVLNRVRPSAVRGPVRAELTDALVRFGGQPPAAFLPLDQDSLDAAVLAGASVAAAAPGSAFRAAVAELATALCGSPADEPGGRRGRRAAGRAARRRRAHTV